MKPAIFLLLQIAFGMLFAWMTRQRLVFRMLMKTKSAPKRSEHAV